MIPQQQVKPAIAVEVGRADHLGPGRFVIGAFGPVSPAATADEDFRRLQQWPTLGARVSIPDDIGAMAGQQVEGNELTTMEAIIHSMTPEEREDPTMIEASRRRRIARGSGTQPQDVSGMVKMIL